LRKFRGKKIYYITQDPYNSFDPTYKIGKQFKEFSIEKGVKYKKEFANKILNELGFDNPDKILNLYPFQLSGGMLQRVSIARGVLVNPELIIADEPTTGLDYELQLDFVRLLKDIITNKNLSLLFITHNMKIVEEFKNDTTLVLYKGEIVEESKNILKNSLHPYSRILINSVPSNWKKGEILDILKDDKTIEDSSLSGCKFYNKCKFKKTICKKNPPFIKTKNGFVKCFLYKY
jgi:peptide/nickel transport system ATP-binding protein